MPEQKTPLKPEEKTPNRAGQIGARDRLRLRLADLQCALVRMRYKLKKRSGDRKRASGRKLRAMPFYNQIGALLYSVGFQGEYFLLCSWRNLCRFGRLVGRLTRILGGRVATFFAVIGYTVLNDMLMPVAVFFRGIFHVFRHANQVRREKGMLRAVWEGLCYLGRGIRLYARLLPRVATYILPVAVGVVCVTYVHARLNVEYLLAVQVNQQTVGYVQSENVFESAKAAVGERINYAGTSHTSWNVTPSYKLAELDGSQNVMNENQMADAILETSGDEIAEGTALYIDGSLCRVMADGASLANYLDTLKAPYEAAADENTIVQFNHAVELVNGIFFTDSFSDYEDVLSYLSADEIKQQDYTVVSGDSIGLIASKNGLTRAELYDLNADIGLNEKSALFPGDTLVVQRQEKVLEVQTVQTLTYQEAIPYATETTESDEYAFGTTKTIQEGQDGISSVTAQITRDANGVEISNIILSRETIQEPVTRKVVKGTKTPLGTIASVGNGSFMWPVPGYRYVSRWMSATHKGVDICAASGTPILAADSGVVIKAGYNAAGTGYGNSIVIDHGNGYRTLYGHAVALYVSVGQAVKQGQVIAGVGTTGRSTGNHLHFEILYNGGRLAPQNVFSGYR